MQVMIAVPTHDNMPALFAYDLAQMMAFLGTNFVGPDAPFDAMNLTFCTGTYIHSARQDLAQLAIEQGADYVLWLDSDMRFPKDAFIRLLKQQEDIVGINYSHRGVPPGFVAIKSVADAKKLVTGPESTGLEEVEAVGFGVLLMRGRVLQRLAQDHNPLFKYEWREDGTMVGEDVYFCQIAREAGFKVFVDHDLSKECGHIGQLEYKTDHAYVLDNCPRDG